MGIVASGELLHPDYFHARTISISLGANDVILTMLAPHSLVLDLGSGAGLLALLKRKDITLVV